MNIVMLLRKLDNFTWNGSQLKYRLPMSFFYSIRKSLEWIILFIKSGYGTTWIFVFSTIMNHRVRKVFRILFKSYDTKNRIISNSGRLQMQYHYLMRLYYLMLEIKLQQERTIKSDHQRGEKPARFLLNV